MSEDESDKPGCLGWFFLALLVVGVIYLIVFVFKHFWAVIFLAIVALGIIYAANYRGIRDRLRGGSGVAVIILCFFLLAGSTVWMVYDLKPTTTNKTAIPAATTTPEEEKQTAPIETEPTQETQPRLTFSEVYGGLHEAERQRVYYDLEVEQQKYPPDDPRWAQNNEDSYVVISQRYNVSREAIDMITVEGVEKRWPSPPVSSF